MTEKAGMNAVEFDKYLVKAILSLYLDMEDTPQKGCVVCCSSLLIEFIFFALPHFNFISFSK